MEKQRMFSTAALFVCLLSITLTGTVANNVKKYVVKDGNRTCFQLQMELLNVSLSFNNSNQTVIRAIDVPQLNATGTCAKDHVSMALNWPHSNDSYLLTLKANRNETAGVYYISTIKLMYYVAVPGDNNTMVLVNGTGSDNTLEAFSTNLTQYYTCDNQGYAFPLSNNVTVSMMNLKFQAFSNSTTNGFTGKENNCKPIAPEKPTSILVPIIVGAALGGMILLVLIGYCIGRRRNRSGYTEIEA